jgi:hypothetical protein
MNCGECKKWARCGMTNHGVCGTTNLYTRDHEGAKCTISEPMEVEPKAESWPDAKTREAAENPRVGDVYATKFRNPDLEVIEVVETVIKYRYLHGAKISFVHSRDGWVGYLGAGAIKSFLVSRGPEPKPLRDGDIFWLDNGFYCHFHDTTGPCIIAQKQHGQITSDRRFLFNILSLAAAVQRGEKVVTLTRQEIRDLLDGYTANAKLRAAIGGGQ